MSLVVSLFVLLAAAHALGALSTRLNQPALVGHFVAGVLLGPSVLEWIEPQASLRALSDLAVLIVVLNAGLEMRMQHLTEELRGWNIGVLALGFAAPAAAGLAVGAMFSLPPLACAVIALCLAVTALPVALQILSGMGLLDTPVARLAIAGALLTDVLVFAVLGVLIDLSGAGAVRSVFASGALAAGKLLVLTGVVALAYALCRGLIRRRRSEAPASGGSAGGELAYALLFVLALAGLSELAGFHFAIGAFLAALMITPELIGERSFEQLERTSNAVTVSLFGPLFLSFQGLQFHLQSLSNVGFVAALVATAVLAKLLSGYLVGRLRGMGSWEAWGVGIVMNARGVMELVTATIAFQAGLINAQIFSALVLVGLVTTMLTPVMLRRWQERGARGSVREPAA